MIFHILLYGCAVIGAIAVLTILGTYVLCWFEERDDRAADLARLYTRVSSLEEFISILAQERGKKNVKRN